ncbi:MAG: aldehyde dehydrogenase family protein [Anaerolineae bacterium]
MTRNEQAVLPFINPATGERFGEVAMATADDVARAHKEMRQAFDVWRRKSVRERVRILRQFQALIIDALDEVTAVINQDTGKSRQDGLIEVMVSVDRLHQYYKHAPRWLRRRRVPPGLYMFKRYYTEPHPVGVVAVIGPWNYPFDLTVPVVCSALLAGNTVILKPSEVTPATGALIEDLFQRVPELAPFVRVLHGDGVVGAMLVDSRPDLVFLTGSTATGRIVAKAAAEHMIPFLCELGGKDPMIVLEDADIPAAARWGAWGAFYNTGQTCMGVERVYVVEPVYDEFVREVVAQTQKLKVGFSPEFDNQYDIGPLTFERQVHIIEDHMQDALAKGARVLVGGKIEGLFMEPTVVVDVDHSMKLMREETFGPILPIMKVQDEAEALALANDNEYGLSACVWSQDMRQAKRVAHRLDVGSVNVNDAISHYPVSLLPFGGVKQSGNARTHGQQEVLQFTQLRSYAIGRPPLPIDLATRMREPGHYRLGAAVMRLAFGVTTKQRLQPLAEALAMWGGGDGEKKAGKLAAVLGSAAAAAAVLLGLARSRK